MAKKEDPLAGLSREEKIAKLSAEIKADIDRCPPRYLPLLQLIVREDGSIDWNQFVSIYLQHEGRNNFNMDHLTCEIIKKGYLVKEEDLRGGMTYRVTAKQTKTCEYLLSVREIISIPLCFPDEKEAEKFAQAYLDTMPGLGTTEVMLIDEVTSGKRKTLSNKRAVKINGD